MLFVRRSFLNFELLFYVALSITLMLLESHQNHVRTIRAALSAAVVPIQYLVSWPIQVMDWFSASLTSQKALLAENADLRAQLLISHAKLQKLLALEQENNKLRALLQSSPRAGGRVTVAQLLAINLEPFVHQVILNKGAREGVYVGQPVIDANGIFGQVIEVGPLTSRVLLITDTQFAIPVEDTRNGLRGIVVGTGNPQMLSLVSMPQTADIKPGDQLVTSGLGGRFPAGYPVGRVESVVFNSDEEFAKIKVYPSAELNRSLLVLLVWVDKNSLNQTASLQLSQPANPTIPTSIPSSDPPLVAKKE